MVPPVAMPSSTTMTVRPRTSSGGRPWPVELPPALDLRHLARRLGLDVAVARLHRAHDILVQHDVRMEPVDDRAEAELLLPRRADLSSPGRYRAAPPAPSRPRTRPARRRAAGPARWALRPSGAAALPRACARHRRDLQTRRRAPCPRPGPIMKPILDHRLGDFPLRPELAEIGRQGMAHLLDLPLVQMAVRAPANTTRVASSEPIGLP